MTDISNANADPFAKYLRANELIRWRGRPDPRIWFSPFDKIAVPFSVAWAGFAVVWNSAVWAGDKPLFMRLFGLPFLATGFYITIGRFIMKRRRKLKVRYALTNQRALLIGRLGQIRWVELKDVLHETLPKKRANSICVAFRYPSQPLTASYMMFSDPEIDPAANFSGRNQFQSTLENFIFSDVSDGAELLRVLNDSPSAI